MDNPTVWDTQGHEFSDASTREYMNGFKNRSRNPCVWDAIPGIASNLDCRTLNADSSVVQLCRTSRKPLDAFGNRRVCRKQVGEANSTQQGRDDEQVSR